MIIGTKPSLFFSQILWFYYLFRYQWHHKAHLISKKPVKGNLGYFFLEWEIYANRHWSREFEFSEQYPELYEWYEGGFYKVRGFLFNWVDYSPRFYNTYLNLLNKNRTSFIYPKRRVIFKRKFVPMRKKIYKNYLRISYSFGRYVRFYKSFLKIEYFLYMEPQYIISQGNVTKKYVELFSTFKFTKQLFIYFLKYNKKNYYTSIQYRFNKYFTSNLTNMFMINSPYLWLPSPHVTFDITDDSEYNINFDSTYTSNLFETYYIYSNNKDFKRFEDITNLNDFKFVDWEYYTDGSGVYELDIISISDVLVATQLINKFCILELYKSCILLYIHKMSNYYVN